MSSLARSFAGLALASSVLPGCGLASSIERNSRAIEKTTGSLERTSRGLERSDRGVEALRERLDGLGAPMGRLGAGMAGLEGRMSRMEASLSRLEKPMADLSALGPRLEAVSDLGPKLEAVSDLGPRLDAASELGRRALSMRLADVTLASAFVLAAWALATFLGVYLGARAAGRRRGHVGLARMRRTSYDRRTDAPPGCPRSDGAMKREKRLTKRERKALAPARPQATQNAQHIHCIACGRHLEPDEFQTSQAVMLRCQHGSTFPACAGCRAKGVELLAEHDRTGQAVRTAGAWH